MRAKLTAQGALLSSFSSDLHILSIPLVYALEGSFIVYSFSLKKTKQFLKKHGLTLTPQGGIALILSLLDLPCVDCMQYSE